MDPQSTSTMSTATDATSTSCHELDIQDICHKTSHLMESIIPNGTFSNCTKNIFKLFLSNIMLTSSIIPVHFKFTTQFKN